MTMKALSPADANSAIWAGAMLVDIRDADEHARSRIAGAINLPLAQIDALPVAGRPIIFHCRSGMRTAANEARLAAAAQGAPAYSLDGGIDGWRSAGLPVVVATAQPIEVMRQVQLAAGALVVIAVLLGTFLATGFLALAGLVGAGLMFAGATGWCGMATSLRAMPWNCRKAT
jgi:rhodanese-related sulfurtransferase